MGRTMEALKQPKGSRRPSGATTSTSPASDDQASPSPAHIPAEIAARGRDPVHRSRRPGFIGGSLVGCARGDRRVKRKTPSPHPQAVQPEEPQAAPAGTPQAAPLTVAFQSLPLALSRGATKEHFARELVALHQPEHPLTEQYRALVSSLTDHLPPGESHVFLLTRGACEAGKSTVLLNLAIAYARGQRTGGRGRYGGQSAVPGRQAGLARGTGVARGVDRGGAAARGPPGDRTTEPAAAVGR